MDPDTNDPKWKRSHVPEKNVFAIAILSGIAGALAVGATILTRALQLYRAFPSIDGFYMFGIPFLFQVITSMTLAYTRKYSMYPPHVGVMILGLFTGAICYGYTLLTLLFDDTPCTGYPAVGDCNKPVLVYMIVVAGGGACAFTMLGLLVTLCSYRSALIRRQRYIIISHEENYIKSKPLQSASHKTYESQSNGQSSTGFTNPSFVTDIPNQEPVLTKL